MTTSGTTTYSVTVGEAIETALMNLDVLGGIETIAAEDQQLGLRMLNLILKHFQGMGMNLWTRSTGILFVDKDTSTYSLNSSGANATTSYNTTTTTAAAASSATFITVSSTSGMTVGDYIGIAMDSGYFLWTTISTLPGAGVITFPTALTAASASGSRVYTYTTKLSKPLEVFNFRSYNFTDDSVIHLKELGIDAFEGLYAPTLQSDRAFQWAVDYQKDTTKVSLWPLVTDPNIAFKFSHIRVLEDVTDISQTIDVPQIWYLAIIDALAVRLAPAFNKEDKAVKLLVPLAQSSLSNAMQSDTYTTDVVFGVDRTLY